RTYDQERTTCESRHRWSTSGSGVGWAVRRGRCRISGTRHRLPALPRPHKLALADSECECSAVQQRADALVEQVAEAEAITGRASRRTSMASVGPFVDRWVK